MKRITLIALLSGLGAICAQAGNDTAKAKDAEKYSISNSVQKENNFRNALWMESGNSAGLAFSPFRMYKDLDVSYEYTSGEFRQAQDANRINNISLNTSGSAWLGKFIVWGKFSFRNIFEKGRNMNALMYELQADMPYYPIDTTSNSGWTKQEYELQAKVVSPVLWNRVSFGIDVHYVNKVGAKHLDPRTETYKYFIDIKPAITVRLGHNFIGANAIYTNGYERAHPRNMNNWINQQVELHKGLGEAVKGKVGDNDGLKTYMFKNDIYGGSLQYGFKKDVELLADFSYLINNTHVISNPSLPKNEGSTKRNDIRGKVELLFGKDQSNNLWIEGLYRKTTGIEYITQIQTVSSTEQYWQVLSQNQMSTYNLITASLGYDHQFGASDPRGYNWVVGAHADFMMRNDNYLLPASSFKATTASAEAFGGKHLKFKASSLLIKIKGGYNMSLGSTYEFGGKNNTYKSVQMYKEEKSYYEANYANAGGLVCYTLNTKKVGYIFNIAADYIKPLGVNNDRLFATASFGIVF